MQEIKAKYTVASGTFEIKECANAFPAVDNVALLALEKHNARWYNRYANWLKHAIPPWWSKNLIITPEIRESYEKWLPIDEFCGSLTGVGRAYLPEESWMPLPLRSGTYLSLPDFWAAMPSCFGGKVCFEEGELPSLFCAMADPPRFGTTAGRYPEELRYLMDTTRDGMSLLDVGCGVGLNTLEIASALKGMAVVGITPEPLEVWMAQNRCLPHDFHRQTMMRQFDGKADFMYGRAEEFSGDYDVIVCNGLVGGRFFHEVPKYQAFLHCCRESLCSGGRLIIADRFHEGSQRNIERFKRMAVTWGFSCDEKHGGFLVFRLLASPQES